MNRTVAAVTGRARGTKGLLLSRLTLWVDLGAPKGAHANQVLYALGVLVDEGGWQISVGVVWDAVCGIDFEELGTRILLCQLIKALLQGGALRHPAH